MSWWSDLFGDKDGLDWINTLVGLWEASEKSGKQPNIRELYRMSNPDVNTPWYSSTTDWSTGHPVQSVKYSDAFQPIMDSVMAQLANPRQRPDPYELPESRRELQNARVNYQRARYGLGPAAYTPLPQRANPDINTAIEILATQPHAIGENRPDPDDPDESTDIIDDSDNPTILDGANEEGTGGSGQNPVDEIIEEINTRNTTLNGGRGGGSSPSDGVNIPGDHLNWDWGMSPTEFLNSFKDTHNASDIDALFGYLDIPSENGVWALEKGTELGGRILSLLSGVPGLGWLAEKVGQHFLNKKAQFNPLDSGDPYNQYGFTDTRSGRILEELVQNPEDLGRSTVGQGNTNLATNPGAHPYDVIADLVDPDGNLPQSGMMEGNTNVATNRPSTSYASSAHNSGGVGRGSITGGGAYGYPTRLKPRHGQMMSQGGNNYMWDEGSNAWVRVDH